MANGPTRLHAIALLRMIEGLEDQIDMASGMGHVPLLDAVEVKRILRALVRGDESYKPDEESLKEKARRLQSGAGYTVFPPPIMWKIPSEGGGR